MLLFPMESKIEIIIKKTEPPPSIAYDSYWRFAAERQKVFFQRVRHYPPPWTEDPILKTYKFTNAYRASDRVSQYLIKYVIYDAKHSPKDLLFRILLFKTFNKIETWEALIKNFIEVNTKTYSFDAYDKLLTHLSETGHKIYSGAYIMASGRRAFGSHRKHRNHLKLIELMIADELYEKIPILKSMKQLYDTLLSYPTIGNFLAYQYAIDINYSELTSFSEMDFVVAGPGAKDGIKKCFSNYKEFSEDDIIKYVTERQELEFERLGLIFEKLGNRPLQLIDCQNLFCEVDKYSRVAHPELTGISGRKKIKQKFVQKSSLITPWFPPKWGINDQISPATIL